MTTSRIPAVVDALVTILTAALPDVDVYDGRWVTAPASTRSYLTVGWTPEEEGPSGEQSWAGLGAKARDERIAVPCYADAYSGSTDTAERRNAAFELLTAAEDALRADPTLGGAVLQPGWAEVGNYSVRQEQTDAGLEVGVTFVINVTTRI